MQLIALCCSLWFGHNPFPLPFQNSASALKLVASTLKVELTQIQMFQDAAARISANTRKFDCITPVIAPLPLPPTHIQSDFKVLLMTFKIINGLAPSYLSDLIKPYIPPWALCSQNTGLLSVPRVKKKSAGCRTISHCAAFLWNSPLADIRRADSTEALKFKFKINYIALTFN